MSRPKMGKNQNNTITSSKQSMQTNDTEDTWAPFSSGIINSHLKPYIDALDCDPAALVSTEEYLDLLTKAVHINDALQNSDSVAGAFYKSSNLYNYIQENLPEAGLAEKRREILRILEYQDELLFIQEGSDISYFPIQHGLPAHLHRNAYFDIAYVFKGTARFYFEDTEAIDLRSGDFLIVPMDSAHGECCLDIHTRAITCAIRKSAFLRVFLSLFNENALLYSFFRRMLTGQGSIAWLKFDTSDANGAPDSEIQRILLHIMKEQDIKPAYYDKMMEADMEKLFVTLLRFHEAQMQLPSTASIHWKSEYDALFRYMEANSITVTMEELTEHFHYSRRQLSRIFLECTGQTFEETVKAARMRLARELLAATDLPIEEIAHRCGYENMSSFARVFKATEGKTPGEYRRTMNS